MMAAIRYRIACWWWGWCHKHRCEKVDDGYDGDALCVECCREKHERKNAARESATVRWDVKRND